MPPGEKIINNQGKLECLQPISRNQASKTQITNSKPDRGEKKCEEPVVLLVREMDD
jgi:hypothetical protein